MSQTCTLGLSRKATAFLVGLSRSLNDKKILPAGDSQALETSAWLEEIEAAATKAARGDRMSEVERLRGLLEQVWSEAHKSHRAINRRDVDCRMHPCPLIRAALHSDDHTNIEEMG